MGNKPGCSPVPSAIRRGLAAMGTGLFRPVVPSVPRTLLGAPVACGVGRVCCFSGLGPNTHVALRGMVDREDHIGIALRVGVERASRVEPRFRVVLSLENLVSRT